MYPASFNGLVCSISLRLFHLNERLTWLFVDISASTSFPLKLLCSAAMVSACLCIARLTSEYFFLAGKWYYSSASQFNHENWCSKGQLFIEIF